jgi:hypothetical protein
MVDDFYQQLVTAGYIVLIKPRAADDIEQGTSQGWDCPGATRQFVDGYNNREVTTNNLYLFDYGTAALTTCWTDTDLYYVAYGPPLNYPLPEIYFEQARKDWYRLEDQHHEIQFQGVMSSCPGDPPQESCMGTWWGPATAWTMMNSGLTGLRNQNGLGMQWATNIQSLP